MTSGRPEEEAHPSSSRLRIGEVSIPGTGGVIGMTLCPGKKGPSTRSARLWDRDLAADLLRIRRWGAEAVVTLMEHHELVMLEVGGLGQAVAAGGMRWFHMPIVDTQAPNEAFELRWNDYGPQLRVILADGGRVLLHCRGGLGRTGLVAARLLIEFGVSVGEAVRTVRAARPHTIETVAQEGYLEGLGDGPSGVGVPPPPVLVGSRPPAPSRVDPAHFAGCLLGGAVGDALGAPLEFMRLEAIRARFGSSGLDDYVPAFGRLGAITDDTQMTLFTAEGLLDATRADPCGDGPPHGGPPGEPADVTIAVYRAYLRWLITQEGPGLPPSRAGVAMIDRAGLLTVSELYSRRAPGTTCLSALRGGRMGTVAEPLNSSKGCGGVMRVAPVGLLVRSCGYAGSDADAAAFRIGCDAAAITHGHPSGYLSAGALALLLSRILVGDHLEAALRTVRRELARHPGHEETTAALARALDVWRGDSPLISETIEAVSGNKADGGGWVGEEALAISVFCSLAAGRDFSRGVLLAVNHSGDSDSTGAITGAILGTMLGRDAIPAPWLERLELREIIETMAERLYAADSGLTRHMSDFKIG